MCFLLMIHLRTKHLALSQLQRPWLEIFLARQIHHMSVMYIRNPMTLDPMPIRLLLETVVISVQNLARSAILKNGTVLHKFSLQLKIKAHAVTYSFHTRI